MSVTISQEATIIQVTVTQIAVAEATVRIRTQLEVSNFVFYTTSSSFLKYDDISVEMKGLHLRVFQHPLF